MLNERRVTERYAIESLKVSVLCNGRRVQATVLDVSPRGARLTMADVQGVKVSGIVETDHRGNRAQAVVRRITPRDDGTFSVGLEYLT